MKLKYVILVLVSLMSFSWGQATSHNDKATDDKKLIKELVIKVLKWHDKNGTLAGFEPIFNSGNNSAIGMDLKVLQKELDKLTTTRMFDKEFIDNYQKIVQTLDKKIKNKEIEIIDGEMPPYAEADPWCNCQDIPYDNPWDKIEINFVSIDEENAALTWTWGDSDWSKDFQYMVRAKKVNGTWKIAYLQGFDFNEMTK